MDAHSLAPARSHALHAFEISGLGRVDKGNLREAVMRFKTAVLDGGGIDSRIDEQ
jgi:hypothetical protein